MCKIKTFTTGGIHPEKFKLSSDIAIEDVTEQYSEEEYVNLKKLF